MGFLLGDSKSESKNQAYPWLQNTFGGQSQQLINQGANTYNVLSGAMGLGDPSAANASLANYRRSTGFNSLLADASRGLTSSAAGQGLLSSGATARALQANAAQMGQQNYANWLGQLMNLGQLQFGSGADLANIIGGAGGHVKQSSTGGLLPALSGAAQNVGFSLGGGGA